MNSTLHRINQAINALDTLKDNYIMDLQSRHRDGFSHDVRQILDLLFAAKDALPLEGSTK